MNQQQNTMSTWAQRASQITRIDVAKTAAAMKPTRGLKKSRPKKYVDKINPTPPRAAGSRTVHSDTPPAIFDAISASQKNRIGLSV